MRTQRGGVLIASLMVLMLLALVGLSGANTTTLEERMAGNFRDQRVAFESAEAVLQAAEQWLKAMMSPRSEPVPALAASVLPTIAATGFASMARLRATPFNNARPLIRWRRCMRAPMRWTSGTTPGDIGMRAAMVKSAEPKPLDGSWSSFCAMSAWILALQSSPTHTAALHFSEISQKCTG